MPAGCWQSARPAGGEAVLVSCVVSPGFDVAVHLARLHRLAVEEHGQPLVDLETGQVGQGQLQLEPLRAGELRLRGRRDMAGHRVGHGPRMPVSWAPV